MVQVSYPGVYIQEVPSGARTITGVATAIAAFVGMTKRGPINQPTSVLGFTDYVRVFSDDTSQGELTDQVRQFFLNGGQQAYVVRIAHNAASSTAALAANLTLTAKSAGQDGDSLRAAVDYNTSAPESTFNLTLFRETFDAAGVSSIGEQETLRDLSMDDTSSRFVERVLEQDSVLATAAVGTVAGNDSSSIAALIVPAADDLAAAVGGAVTAAVSGPQGKFTLRLGSEQHVVSVPKAASISDTDIKTAIDAVFPSAITTNLHVEYLTVAATKIVKIRHTALEVRITPAPDSDISAVLGLGVGQGGLEIGTNAVDRPLPSGLVTNVGADAAALIALSQALKSSFGAVTVTGGAGFSTGAVTFPVNTGTQSLSEGTHAGHSLLNVVENLTAIAATINATTTQWRAAVQGYRLVLTPLLANATQGAGNTFTAPAALDAASDPSTARSKAFSGGDDGTKPLPNEYSNAYAALDRVDLFNILVLPKSAADTATPDDRSALWGAASSFCLQRRAFLLVDAATDVDTIAEAVQAVKDLRLGLVKDHSALYWPRVEVNPDGLRRLIDPSGTIAGVMARIDANRGVWKAPAGLEADLRGVLGARVRMSDPENGQLNPQALNAVRVFPSGIVSWGARTMDGFDNSGNDDYKFVPVRRFTSFIEESLFRGLKFAVFEPNDAPLWSQLRLATGAFMNNLFRQGAFAGRTTREAYFVKVDAETTTQNDINLGIVNVVVGFAPLKPAEFVIITIKQQAGQVQV
jgi:phage tail sheath protein FI